MKCLQPARADLRCHFWEIYSRPRIAPLVRELGMRSLRSIDVTWLSTVGFFQPVSFCIICMCWKPPQGLKKCLRFSRELENIEVDNFWDLRDPKIQHMLLSDLVSLKPFFTMLSPPCTHLCQYMFSNWGRMDALTKYELLHQAIGHIDVSCWIAMVQLATHSYYCIENPEGSQAWNRDNASWLQSLSHLAYYFAYVHLGHVTCVVLFLLALCILPLLVVDSPLDLDQIRSSSCLIVKELSLTSVVMVWFRWRTRSRSKSQQFLPPIAQPSSGSSLESDVQEIMNIAD